MSQWLTHKGPVRYTNKLIKKTTLVRKKTQNGENLYEKFVRCTLTYGK